MQYNNGRMAEMVITSPQPSFLWHLYQVGNRWGQSRALHPHNAAERTRYSSKQSLKSWEPDHSFPSHSQMRSNIKKDKTSLRSVFILYFIHLSATSFMFRAFLQHIGVLPLSYAIASVLGTPGIFYLVVISWSFHHFPISTATQPFRQPQYVTASYFHISLNHQNDTSKGHN